MISLKRLFLVLAVFFLYLLAIIFVLDIAKTNTPLYIVLLFGGVVALWLALTLGLLVPGKTKRLLAEGEDVDAVVVSVSDTGVTINKSPYVNLRLRVEPRAMPPYETSVRVLASRLAIPRAGDAVAVRFDPRKPTDLVVVPDGDGR